MTIFQTTFREIRKDGGQQNREFLREIDYFKAHLTTLKVPTNTKTNRVMKPVKFEAFHH